MIIIITIIKQREFGGGRVTYVRCKILETACGAIMEDRLFHFRILRWSAKKSWIKSYRPPQICSRKKADRSGRIDWLFIIDGMNQHHSAMNQWAIFQTSFAPQFNFGVEPR